MDIAPLVVVAICAAVGLGPLVARKVIWGEAAATIDHPTAFVRFSYRALLFAASVLLALAVVPFALNPLLEWLGPSVTMKQGRAMSAAALILAASLIYRLIAAGGRRSVRQAHER